MVLSDCNRLLTSHGIKHGKSWWEVWHLAPNAPLIRRSRQPSRRDRTRGPGASASLPRTCAVARAALLVVLAAARVPVTPARRQRGGNDGVARSPLRAQSGPGARAARRSWRARHTRVHAEAAPRGAARALIRRPRLPCQLMRGGLPLD